LDHLSEFRDVAVELRHHFGVVVEKLIHKAPSHSAEPNGPLVDSWVMGERFGRDTHWFALDETRTLFAFAGIWRLWTGERKGKDPRPSALRVLDHRIE
jgi:hypothetical protein